MKAVGVWEYGGPEALQVLDLPEPNPGPGEVRIRVHAAAVNPTDTLLRAGAHASRMKGLKPPYVPGMDAAGVVEKLGPGADHRLEVGQPVVALVMPTGALGGAYAEQIIAAAASVVPAPEGIDFPAASTLLMNALTARLAIDALHLSPGQAVAITGAVGALGGYAIQLAKADGLRVIADAASADEPLVRKLGADEVVARGMDVADRIRALAPDGVPGLVDGAVLNELVLPALADGGAVSVVRGWDGQTERGITLHQILCSRQATATDLLERLSRQAGDGTLSLRVADILPAARAADAHRLLAAGGIRGRLVLDLTNFDG
ncbi:NADP-dependent oxidoreductase [Kribbella sp. NPDC058245]|uniref:NADP-dependent oxidoreductase n=1 Tax=Kribbella sp. NPDC058245 TaxID=3346399 RepID=UPI0036ED13BA